MMAFFLTMPISIRRPMTAMTDRSKPDQPMAQQRAGRRGGQARQDGQRVDEALIENAEHDVDGDDRAENEKRLVGGGVLERLGGAVECRRDGLRHAELGLQAIDLLDAVAERHAVRQIVGDGHRRQLPELVDGEQAGVAFDAGEGADRNQLSGGCRHLDLGQPLGRPVDPRIELHDHLVAVARRIDRRHLLRRRSRHRASSAGHRL